MANPKAFNRTKSLINLLEKRGERASEGTLRLETLLGTSGNYTFQINENQNKLVTEYRLRSGDAFIPTKIGMFIRRVTCVANNPTDAQLSIGQLHTFANAGIFTGTGETLNLEVLYNSRIQINVNSVNLTEFYDTQRFKRVGLSQQGIIQGTGVVSATTSVNKSDWQGADFGFNPYEQDIAFNGQANNQVQVILPSAVDCSSTTAVTTANNYLVVIFKGVLIQNGAKTVSDKSIKTFMSNA